MSINRSVRCKEVRVRQSFRSMRSIVAVAVLGAAVAWVAIRNGAVLPADAQAPAGAKPAPAPRSDVPILKYDVAANFLKNSADMNFGEVLGVAVNSRGNVVVLNHPGSATSGPLYGNASRSEEHTSELQSLRHLVCRLLLEKKKKKKKTASLLLTNIKENN